MNASQASWSFLIMRSSRFIRLTTCTEAIWITFLLASENALHPLLKTLLLLQKLIVDVVVPRRDGRLDDRVGVVAQAERAGYRASRRAPPYSLLVSVEGASG